MPRPPIFYSPFLSLAIIVFVFGLLFFLALIQVGVISVALAKLGLSANQALFVLFGILLGSMINIPVTSRPVSKTPAREQPVNSGLIRTYWRRPLIKEEFNHQLIGLNLGGCVIPVLLCLSLLEQTGLSLSLIICLFIVTTVTYRMAKPIQGVGIGIPVFIPPLITVIATWLFAPIELQPQIAYISGTLGTLLGADLLHLWPLGSKKLLDAPFLSIGGAGTFDGIFLTGILAVLLT